MLLPFWIPTNTFAMRPNDSFIKPKLPKALLDQIGGDATNNKKNATTRKERRKNERNQKKQSHQQSRSRPAPQRPQPQRRPQPQPRRDEFDESDDEPAPPPAPKPKSKPTKEDKPKSILKTTKKQDPARSKTLEDSPPPPAHVSRAVKDRLAQDDAEIASLEKKLGIKSTKRSKAFADDGLDDLLEGLDDEEDDDGPKRKRSDDDDWLRQKRRKVSQAVAVQEPSDDDEEDENDDDMSGDEDELDGLDDIMDGLGESDEDDDLHGLEDDDEDDLDEDDELNEGSDNGMDNEKFEDFDEDDEDSEEEAPAPRVRENPYVAPVPAGTAPVQKYIPPSLRGAPSSDTEALARLRRQIQGQLNRLSEANLLSILQTIEEIYQNNPRQYVTTTLIDLLLGLICDRTILQDTFLILHAGFMAALYKVIGTDFGAQVIERIVNDFDRHYTGGTTAGKETSNLMSLVSELYNFQVVGCNLVFDYIRLFLTELNEANTELLLKIIRNSGPQLRADDPSALKDIVILVQKEVTRIGEVNLSVRTKFMIETINNLKNNRVKTGAVASAIVSEHTTRMRKTIGSLNNRSSLKASEPLRIGLADIRDTEKKGKWWLVGASWLDPGKQSKDENGIDAPVVKASKNDSTTVSADDGSVDMIQLARQQGMNTDIRRAIFVTIMSASDYQDAHLRLLKLGFKKAQELEIPRVLVHCAGAEATYNPYYTLIAKKLCAEKRMLKAFQFGLWDIFKRMGEKAMTADDEDDAFDDDEDENMSTRKIVNLARFYADLITEGGFPITALKTLNFAYLQPKTNTFTEVLLTRILIKMMKNSKGSKWELSVNEVFAKAQDVPDMVQGLRYFMQKVVRRAEIATGKKERKAVKDGCVAAIEALTTHVARDDGSEDILSDSD
jgi:nucleolar MIF4G domain-containing protein 1